MYNDFVTLHAESIYKQRFINNEFRTSQNSLKNKQHYTQYEL